MTSVDLHSHSYASDGILSPEALVARAGKNGVDIFALTDHDTLLGLPEAQAAARNHALRLISGVEISTLWDGLQIHIVGLDFDAEAPTLIAALAKVSAGRIERAHRMSDELAKAGIPNVFEGAMRYAKNPHLISRSHFARYLVEIGVSKNIHSVFDHYLAQDRPGYVPHPWPSIAEAVSWILAAGGMPVVVHPGRYRIGKTRLRELFTVFKDAGGRAIEVISGSQAANATASLAKLAKEFDFLASCGSDFHSETESTLDIGRLPRLPVGLTPIWEAFSGR